MISVPGRKAPAQEEPRQGAPRTESEPHSVLSFSPLPASQACLQDGLSVLEGRGTYHAPRLLPQTHIHTAESPACPRQACKGQAVTPAERCWGGAGCLVDHCCCGCRRLRPQLQLAPTPISSTCPLSPSLSHMPEITALALGIQKDA